MISDSVVASLGCPLSEISTGTIAESESDSDNSLSKTLLVSIVFIVSSSSAILTMSRRLSIFSEPSGCGVCLEWLGILLFPISQFG